MGATAMPGGLKAVDGGKSPLFQALPFPGEDERSAGRPPVRTPGPFLVKKPGAGLAGFPDTLYGGSPLRAFPGGGAGRGLGVAGRLGRRFRGEASQELRLAE